MPLPSEPQFFTSTCEPEQQEFLAVTALAHRINTLLRYMDEACIHTQARFPFAGVHYLVHEVHPSGSPDLLTMSVSCNETQEVRELYVTLPRAGHFFTHLLNVTRFLPGEGDRAYYKQA